MNLTKWNRKSFFWYTLKNNKFPFSLIFIFSAISSVIQIYLPQYFGEIIGNFDQANILSAYNIQKAKVLLLIAGITILLQVVLGISKTIFSYNFEKLWLFKLVGIALNIDYETYQKMQSGYLNKRVLSDIKSITAFFTDYIFGILFNLIIIVISTIYMIKLLSMLTLFILIFMLILAGIGIYVYKYSRKWLDEIAEIWALFVGFFNQVILNLIMIRGFKIEKNIEKTLSNRLKFILKKNIKVQINLYLILFALVVLFLAIFAFGIYYIISEKDGVSVEIIVTYLALLWLIIQKTTSVLNLYSSMQKNIVFFDRTISILNLKTFVNLGIKDMIQPLDSLEIVNFKKSIGDKDIFENVNFSANRGDIVAIHGDSGAGKTTLLRMIFGFIDSHDGKIILNGKIEVNNLRDYTNVVYLPQEIFLFSGTMEDNLKIFNDEFDEILLKELLTRLKLDTRIDYQKLSEINIEESGKNVSGGEKQRIMLLSLLLKDPDIIILDEPTSQVDIGTEDIIKEIIKEEASKGKIIFVVGHRENLIEVSDKIYNVSTGEFKISLKLKK